MTDHLENDNQPQYEDLATDQSENNGHPQTFDQSLLQSGSPVGDSQYFQYSSYHSFMFPEYQNEENMAYPSPDIFKSPLDSNQQGRSIDGSLSQSPYHHSSGFPPHENHQGSTYSLPPSVQAGCVLDPQLSRLDATSNHAAKKLSPDDFVKFSRLRYAELYNANSSFQLYANLAVIRMYDHCHGAFSGPLDPRTLPYPSHESALLLSHDPQRTPLLEKDSQSLFPDQSSSDSADLIPTSLKGTSRKRKASHVQSTDYDPLLMKSKDADESSLDLFVTNKKFDEFFREGAFHTGDRLVFDVEYRIGHEICQGEGNPAFKGSFSGGKSGRQFPDLDFYITDTDVGAFLPSCKGPTRIIEFLHEHDIKGPYVRPGVFTEKTQVYRGDQYFGSLEYFKKAYHHWISLKDEEATQTGQPWRRRTTKDGQLSARPSMGVKKKREGSSDRYKSEEGEL